MYYLKTHATDKACNVINLKIVCVKCSENILKQRLNY